jgi:hypothetical protein
MPEGVEFMRDKPRRRRQTPDLGTNTSPDAVPDDVRRSDLPNTPPDSLPPGESGRNGERPAGGGFTPAEDGGNAQHPIHDEDQEDLTPSDYEREIDRLDAAVEARIS